MKRRSEEQLHLMAAAASVRTLLRRLAPRLDGEDRELAVQACSILSAALKARVYRYRSIGEEDCHAQR